MLLHGNSLERLVHRDIIFDVLLAIALGLRAAALAVVLRCFRLFVLHVARRRLYERPAGGQFLHVHVCAVLPDRAFVLAGVADWHGNLFVGLFDGVLAVFVRVSVGLECMLFDYFLSELLLVLNIVRLDSIERFSLLLRLYSQSAGRGRSQYSDLVII